MNTRIATASAPPVRPSRRFEAPRNLKAALTDGSVVIGLVTVVLFFISTAAIPGFATLQNLRALFLSVALVGIAAIGLSIITIVGKMFSLSVSAMIAASTIVFASTLQYGAWTAIIAAILFGAVTGAAQGFLVGKLGTDPIVTTIAAAAVITGVAQILTGGLNVASQGDAGVFRQSVLGVIPFQVFIFFLVAAASWWCHRYTVIGRKITMVGLNEKAALVSGQRSWPMVLLAFVVSGVLAGLAGGLLASEAGQGNLQLGATFGFDAITAVVVGGISIKGGLGNPLGAAVGAVLVGLLGNALILLGFSYEIQLIFKGVLVLLAVVGTGIATNRQSGRKR
ncbi:ABC transporter permease [Arthrobacter sp. Marseille-P9274]|uniref:ABC transporter permease n=1 Tax=Arthrobacter sp. Marseille-P9274 TaxID=2866572 RepID=UPI0021C8DAB9|nr:ABC transporter permease [Arthrobacter sp. Marseille-P9274]